MWNIKFNFKLSIFSQYIAEFFLSPVLTLSDFPRFSLGGLTSLCIALRLSGAVFNSCLNNIIIIEVA